MSRKDSFQLDDQTVPFKPGDTIMQAATRAGHYIPHLCYHPDFQPHGSCRICIVDVDGKRASACTEPARSNTVVANLSEPVMVARRTLLQMLFVEGNHVCPGCEKSGACQLQAVAYFCEMLAPHFTHFFPRREVDASHPDTIIDFNRCILCELCVRASRDVDGKNVFAIDGRGFDSHLVINSDSGKLGDSQYESCDLAASVCPVGAILPRQQAYARPIGQRRYDRQPVSELGDVPLPHRRDEAEK